MKRLLIAGMLFAAGVPAGALDDPNRVTVPTAASIVGVAPFFSDVRVFNTSYESTGSIEATYRCFIGACPAAAPRLRMDLPPRQSIAFDDMVADDFAAPNSAGGIEFQVTSGGTAADIGVTSRLYSTSPTPTVGMLAPGVPSSAARQTSFLGQIANGGSGRGFRTNVGAFNGGDVPVTAVFDVFNANGERLGTQTRQIAARSGVQINNVFAPIGRASEAIDDAVIVVTATGDVFSFAAVIDNETTDPFLVLGGEDPPAPPGFEPPEAPRLTPTPTVPPSPTPTPTPPASQTAVVNVGQGGLNFVDQTSGSSVTSIQVGDTVRWVWVGGSHSTTSGTCQGGCRPDGLWDSGVGSGLNFSRTFTQAGSFPYYCTPHGATMRGVVQVQ